jgi:hypothetical protein
MKPNPLKAWLERATTSERAQLAELAGTSVETIRQLAMAYRNNGVLTVTPEMAGRLARASEKLIERTDIPMPALRREDLSDVCRKCMAERGAK